MQVLNSWVVSSYNESLSRWQVKNVGLLRHFYWPELSPYKSELVVLNFNTIMMKPKFSNFKSSKAKLVFLVTFF